MPYKWNHIVCNSLKLPFFKKVILSRSIQIIACIKSSLLFIAEPLFHGLPRRLSGKESVCQEGDLHVQSLGWEDNLEKEMATHSSILAWEIA